MTVLKEMKESLLHLFFPHTCAGCGTAVLPADTEICLQCIHHLPETHFAPLKGNPAEKLFWGRLPLSACTAQYYFTKESTMQLLMHQLKYKGNLAIGRQLGKLMGEQLLRSGRFDADALIPLPLYPAKEKKRGYNQATVLCEGMAAAMHLPVLDKVVLRPEHTETQTRKGRVERWKNMEGKFILADTQSLQGKKIILVDDVVTTGATLESCGLELLKIPGLQLMLATLCIAAR